MKAEYKIKVGLHPKDSHIEVDGHELPYVRGFRIHSHLDDDRVSRIEVTLQAVKPFELNGKGEIVCNTRVVSRKIAKAVYQSLKKIFEEEKT